MKKRLILCFSLILGSAVQAGQVLINELMYHPASENALEEYLELYNSGTNEVELTGWRFTRGFDFIFPQVALAPGGYLVVAADAAVFKAKYPAATNVVGSWTGQLSNQGETVELCDARGQVIDSVTYYKEGDWGVRLRGSGEKRILSLTRSGSTATATMLGNYRSNDRVIVSGADQSEYNGTYTISSVVVNSGSPYPCTSFTFPVSGEPTSPATGILVGRLLTDCGHAGWAWTSAADGLGRSLERVNPGLPGSYGQNWKSSLVAQGTPGGANSVYSTNTAPLVLETQHFPRVPSSTNSVAITARIFDEHPDALAVKLHWRVDAYNPGAFTNTPMMDDGQHQDGLAGDGLYGGIIPPQTNNAVVEFYVEAGDFAGHTRTWPAPGLDDNGNPIQQANALYQVDNSVYGGTQPFYRLIMRGVDRDELQSFPDSSAAWSNARMNGTLITVEGTRWEVRYLMGLRDRGAGTRNSVPANYAVEIPADHPWREVSTFNLNTQYTHAQLAGSVLARLSGLNSEAGRLVQVRVNNVNRASSTSPQYGCYIHLESTDAEYIDHQIPDDSKGNLYKCQSWNYHATRLGYLGTNWIDYANAGYSKQSNGSENDWSDLIQLTYLLNNTPDTNYATAVRQVVNVDQWMLYFAVNALIDNRETCLANGRGDDYSMYRGIKDPRFMLLPHDWDTVMGQGSGGISSFGLFEAARISTLNQFIKHPALVPIYFKQIKRLADTVFSPAQLNPTLDRILGEIVPPGTLNNMKTYASNRVASLLAQIPSRLSMSPTLPTNSGYFFTSVSPVYLLGQANAFDTRSVRVNGNEATWSAWEGRWSIDALDLKPGINQVLVQALDENHRELERLTTAIWFTRNATTAINGGTLATNTVWNLDSSPYQITGPLLIPPGVTLTLQPGTTVFLDPNVDLTVANGGRLLAEGTELSPIHFTCTPGSNANWGSLVILGHEGSPETRLVNTHLDFNGATNILASGATLFLDQVTFGSTQHQYLALDNSSFVIQNCYFPTPSADFEPVRGTGGIRKGGHGLFLRNYFGAPPNGQDVLHFAGGNRPGDPILQLIGNVFAGASDDVVDLQGADAWIEGNLFLHVHGNESPDTASAVSGSAYNGHTSEVTLLGNIFYDCDQAVTVTEGSFFTLLNNTIVRQSPTGGDDPDAAVICLADADKVEGAGVYLEGNIIYDAVKLVRNWDNAVVTLTNNLLSLPWNGPGGGNSTGNPVFKHLPQLSETTFTSWNQAQILRDWLSLLPGSPARGTGPNGRDQGGVIPRGVSVSGEPIGATSQDSAMLTVGPLGLGSGIPAAGFPAGSGFTHYRWKLDDGEFGPELPTTTLILLTGLADGEHTVAVIGKNDASYYQNDSLLGPDAIVTRSRTWTVDTHLPGRIRINEILAANNGTLTNGLSHPDAVELYNESAQAMDLGGMSLSDDAQYPLKFVFPSGLRLAPGQFLVLYADRDFAQPGIHLGFNLDQDGDSLFLFGKMVGGAAGTLMDSVTYGLQLPDRTIGRLADGCWALTLPTLGGANAPAATGNPTRLKINEWLASAQSVFAHDFVELYNPETEPIDLTGLSLTDNTIHQPGKHPIAPLSFIPAQGFVVFEADGNPNQGARHLNFKLTSDQGMIGLFHADASPIDIVIYGPQQTDVSQGRSPSGAETWRFFSQPTPGSANPSATLTVTTVEIPLISMTNIWAYNQSGDQFTAWREPDFDDADWLSGAALFYVEQNSLPAPKNTPLAIGQNTYYFRTHLNLTNDLNGAVLHIYTILDDGAVIYLNNHTNDALYVNMDKGPVTYDTPARSHEAALQGPFTVSTTNLAPGDNVIAVEVHQNRTNSGDIVFGLSLSAVIITTNYLQMPVRLNEIFAHPLASTHSASLEVDWVELHNPSSNPVDLTDLSLTRDPEDPRQWVFSPGTIISAQSFLVIACNAHAPAAATNTGFKLEANGDALYLFDKPNGGVGLLDSVRFGLQAAGFSIGRSLDQWTLNLPTPGAVNVTAWLGNPANLKINEWMADPSVGEDWLELFNPNSLPVDLGGFYLTDDLNNRTQSRVPALSYIGTGPDAFKRFYADKAPSQGANHVDFKLAAEGEAIGLFDPTGYLVDAISFGPQNTGVSEGRLPDGSAHIVRFTHTPTPGASNYLLPVIVIPPTNQVVAVNGTVKFFAQAAPTNDLQYQWQFNGFNIAFATHDTLVLHQVQTNQAGAYTVVVWNLAGAVTHTVSLQVVEAPSLGNPVLANGELVIAINNPNRAVLVLQVSTNLTHWLPLATNNPPTAQWQFIDVDPLERARFYRIIVP